MATVKRISHPVFVRGPFDIFKKLDPALTNGSSYGQFSYSSSIYFYENADETGVRLLVSGYGTSSTALLEDNIYWLSGRLIAPNAKISPVLYFDHELNFLQGEASSCLASLANKVALYGFGIVTCREDSTEVGNNSQMVKNLMVTLKHVDYDNQSKQSVSFCVKYKIGGDRNLAKTFGLFQMGREVLISGYICGYDTDAKAWIVHALNISLASGHQSSVSLVNEANSHNRPARGRGRIIDVDGDDVAEASNSGPGTEKNSTNMLTDGASPCKGQEAMESSAGIVEEGEVIDSGEGVPFVNTYGKKRTNKQVLGDARKAARLL